MLIQLQLLCEWNTTVWSKKVFIFRWHFTCRNISAISISVHKSYETFPGNETCKQLIDQFLLQILLSNSLITNYSIQCWYQIQAFRLLWELNWRGCKQLSFPLLWLAALRAVLLPPLSDEMQRPLNPWPRLSQDVLALCLLITPLPPTSPQQPFESCPVARTCQAGTGNKWVV